MQMSGADYIVEFLREKKISTVFGYPGSPVLDIYDALYAQKKDENEVRHILARHEQGAIHAASGYARATGFPGICIATSGPGATNLVTGIADAYLDSVPLIVITGQVNVASIGRDAFQEADIMGITIPVTKHNYLVKKPELLRSTLEEAWRIALSDRPGPVLIDIARDILTAEIDTCTEADTALPRRRDNPLTLEKVRDEICSAVSHSYRPVILAGGGAVAAGASEILSIAAVKYNIPVVTTLMGMGIKLSGGANMLGFAGMYGTPAANAAIEQSDLVIAVGTRFSDRTVQDYSRFSHTRMIIHADIDNAEISKNVTADIAAVCDARIFLNEFVNMPIDINKNAIELWSQQLKNIKINGKIVLDSDTERLSCREILRTVDCVCRELHNAVYVTDVGNHQMMAARELEPIFERGFITSGGLGAMGFGLPASIGISVALSDAARSNHENSGKGEPSAEQVVLICGDGGFQMTMQELGTLRGICGCTALPIKIFLMDNGELGMICKMQDEKYGGRQTASKLDNPEFCEIAKAYGIKTVHLSVSDRTSLRKIIHEVLVSDENVFVHCKI